MKWAVTLLISCVLLLGCASAPKPLATGKIAVYRTPTGFVTVTEIMDENLAVEFHINQTFNPPANDDSGSN